MTRPFIQPIRFDCAITALAEEACRAEYLAALRQILPPLPQIDAATEVKIHLNETPEEVLRGSRPRLEHKGLTLLLNGWIDSGRKAGG